jgi:hypothetical protein
MRTHSPSYLQLLVLISAVIGLTSASAEESKHWSFTPLASSTEATPPSETGESEIDRRLSVDSGPAAGRRALIRRASYDLIGLPPEPEAVEAFVADPRSDEKAFGKVVDKLLASPHYGERWGRHWLDLVRYADTAGENSDHPIEDAWRYRNWVIDAFNQDKPYDQFVREQLAGDLLDGGKEVVGTGYLAIARRFGHKIEESMHLTYEDAIDNLGKAFLGLSISCARCHDHKHDPITARDYYALYGVLASTRFPYPGCEPAQQPRDLVPISSSSQGEERRAWEARRDQLNAQAQLASADKPTKTKALKDLAAACYKVVSSGDVPDGGSVNVSREPIQLEVKKGEAIHLSILPRGNYGADTTILDYTISYIVDGKTATSWSPADLMDDFLSANPRATTAGAHWCFLDTKDDQPLFLAGRKDAVLDKPELKAWEDGEAPPSVLVNTSKDPVDVWTKLPPRTFFCHPGPNGPVAIAWLSPIDGKLAIDLKVSDGHPGGDGVAWRLEHFADTKIAETYLALGKASQSDPELQKTIAQHASSEPTVQVAYAVAEGKPSDARFQNRGDHEDLGDPVPREFLSVLGGGKLGSDRVSGRLELAQRITAADNPLTARVMANRIWGWHFGRGLVATPNDFGKHGTPPTHPELLDFLARRLIDEGWSVKAMHRLIMNSAAYRRASGSDEEAARYASFERRRLTAEELRDSLLLHSGRLDQSPGEAHPFPPRDKWSFTQHAPFAADYSSDKRSVYLMRKRNRATPFFALFDGPDPNASTAKRGLTTVPTQALYFMNDPFFHDCANRFATKAIAVQPDERIEFVCRTLFARPATAGDRAGFGAFEKALAPSLPTDPKERELEIWRSYTRILLSTNEFLFLD